MRHCSGRQAMKLDCCLGRRQDNLKSPAGSAMWERAQRCLNMERA